MSVNLPPKRNLEQSWLIRYLSVFLLLGQILLHLLRGKTYYRKILEHTVTAGPASLSPVLLVNGFAGMIFTIQTARELVRFGAVDTVGGAFALAFCRELAPILTASIIAGQVGSAFAAELGAMQVTEQIDALYMLRTDPVDYLVLPRVIACCLMMPVMMIFAVVTGMMGGAFAAMQFLSSCSRNIFRISEEFFITLRYFYCFTQGINLWGYSCC